MKKSETTPSQFDTSNFIYNFSQGDTTAFTDLFNYFYPPLCYFAMQMVSDKPSAEDIAKDSFIKLWNKRADFLGFLEIKAFLYITTKNAALNLLRHRNVKKRTQKEILYLTSDSENQNMLALMIKTELLAELVHARQCLSPQQSKIIQLKYYEGLSNEKVAAKLGVSVTSVKTQVARAIAKLKAYFRNNKEAYIFIVALMSSDFDHHHDIRDQQSNNSKFPQTSKPQPPPLDLAFYGRKVDFRQANKGSNIF